MKRRAGYLILSMTLLGLTLGCDNGDSGADPVINTNPTISITSPVPDAGVADRVEITAVASDDKGIARVEFWVDSVRIDVDLAPIGTDPGSQYQAFWDASAEEHGSNHTVYAIAYDTDRNRSISPAIPCTIDTIAGVPSSPTLHAIEDVTDSSVLLTWSMNTDNDFKQYEIHYDTSSGDRPLLYSIVEADRSDTVMSLTSLHDNIAYRFQIVVRDMFDRIASSNISEATTIDVPPPSPVITGVFVYDEGLRIEWTALDIWDFSSYKIYSSIDSSYDSGDDLIATISDVETISHDYATTDTTGHYYYVMATDISQNSSLSNWHYANRPGLRNFALQFDGTMYATVPYFSALNVGVTYTLEGWVYVIGGAPYARVIDKGPSRGGPLLQYALAIARWVRADVCTGGGDGEYARYRSGSEVYDEEWHHIAYTYDRGTIIFYIDGQPVDTILSGITSSCSYSTPMNIGRRKLYDEFYYFGIIDEVRVWTVARTPAEMAATYDTHLTGSEPGLVCYFDFDEGSGDDISSPVGGNGHLGALSGADSRDPIWVESTAPIQY